ncbi:MAG: glycosyltransferase family A protein [Fidelibacterota bacterium]
MAKYSPEISVIIPVRNRPEKIRRALDSVIAQKVLPAEILVIDDGSTDNTPEVLDSYLSVIKVLKQDNKGVSSARNRGIYEAAGTWIAFLDSDDEWKAEKLQLQTAYLEKHPEIRILQTEETWIRNGKFVNPPKKYLKKGGNIFKASLENCIVSPSTVICQRSLLMETGGFDESLPVCEDYDLWLRIAACCHIPLLPEATVIKYGGHKDQLSTRIPAMDRFRVRSLEKILREETLSDEQEAALLAVLLRKLVYLYNGALRRGTDPSEYAGKIKIYRERKSSGMCAGEKTPAASQ